MVTEPIPSRSRGPFPPTSISLIERASAGDRVATEQIVFLYSPLVDRWCRARHLRQDVVEVVGQEVFLALFKNLGRFRKERPEDGFRKWLWTITKSKVFDHLRAVQDQPACVGGSAAREVLENLPDGFPESESEEAGVSTPDKDWLILMRRCIEMVKAEFEPETYKMFEEVFVEQKPPGDVARSMGKGVGAVYTACSRVKRRLKQLLEQLGENASGL
jgi:RNA polymerase sigma factor (sigma-70 family)